MYPNDPRWIPGRPTMTEYIDADGNAVIPEGVTELDEKAFLRCGEVRAVTIPSSVSVIAGGVFLFCPNLTEIRVAADNPFLSAVDGVLYHSQMGLMLRCPRGKSGVLTVPEGTRHVADRAVCGCSALWEADLPCSVRHIDEYAFQGCAGLTRLTIRSKEIEIADTALVDCPCVVIYAPADSTALSWAEAHGIPCRVLPCSLF